MKYILDFDRTVFDMERLYDRLDSAGIRAKAGTVESLDVVGDISDLLFDDAISFFGNHVKDDLFVVSSASGKNGNWELEYQKEKLQRSGIAKHVSEVFVVEKEKNEVVLNLIEQYGHAVFVDDLVRYLDALAAENVSNLKLVQIDRIGSKEVSGFPTIKSLTELDDIIESS